MDLQSISRPYAPQTIARTVFVAPRSSQVLISEHSLLASGRFDPRRIFKAAMENGAIKTSTPEFQFWSSDLWTETRAFRAIFAGLPSSIHRSRSSGQLRWFRKRSAVIWRAVL